MRINCLLVILAILPFVSCKKDTGENPPPPDTSMYFPANSGNTWETVSRTSLGWKETAVQPLKDYLSQKHTKSFMILVNGRIVMEEYFNGHNASADWEWNSAGKTLVSATVGIAQQNGLLNITDRASDYLGTGWTSEPVDKENLITVKHLLSMTSGISDESNLVIKSNLTYVADAGSRWAYGNVFQKLMDVVAEAGNQDFQSYFDAKLKNKIGMDGYWNFGPLFKIFHSTTRSMARFGLLALNQGKWNNEQIVDESFFKACTNSSQDINPSYGYLWWLNGKSKYMVPGSQNVFQGNLVANALADMYAGMGAADQRVYVIPSRKMVVVRMGEASDPNNPTFAVSGFDNALWTKINDLIN
ncbi:MAG TPA: serine hydrolase [Agriterribacter sp.]|nr:serine hydrolase [Agriterribacter sp.]